MSESRNAQHDPEAPRHAPGGRPPDKTGSPLAPFATRDYRTMWWVWLVANVCTWMNDVASAWLMTSLTSKPIWVALVSTCATLPVFLLGLPSGALADSLDRRRFLLGTQLWVAALAVLMCAISALQLMSPPLLLALAFANGIGLALRWPVFSASIPETVPRSQLPAALALTGVAANASRILGPLMAGMIIAAAGSAWVFALNAVLSVASVFLILRWKRVHVPSPLGREPLLSGMRVGLQFVGQSSLLKSVLLRVGLFFFHSAALLALLPLVARQMHGGGAGTYTALLATMGGGAIAAALLLPRARRRISRDALVITGTMVQSAATLVVAFAPNPFVALPAMALAGAAWITTVNSLSVSAQFGLPDWVRARGMSIYQMAIMGGSAAGAALWGQVATSASVTTALAVAAASGSVLMLLAGFFVADRSIEEDLSRSTVIKAPVADHTPEEGRVLVTIEYRIDPARASEFRLLMEESRRSRLRQGALAWHLLIDIYDPGRFVEEIIDESWTEHLRRFDRVSKADVALRERKLAFHIAQDPPLIQRFIIESEPGR
ncbi:MAG: MFS transporter [Burkholderiales bacterium]